MMPTSFVEVFGNELLRLRLRTQEVVRQRMARKADREIGHVRSSNGQEITRSILEERPPWDTVETPDCQIPGMLTASEKKYYGYVTQFYSGHGAIVELGPWLGQSTFHLISSLEKNASFSGNKMYVYDDFVWRSSWMEKWLNGTGIAPPANHSSFEELFLSQIGDLVKHLVVDRRKISDSPGNESLAVIEWTAGPVELLVVDCGRSLAVNEAWWTTFEESMIPGKTLIVMQDWQNHKRVPELFWENTKIFTDSKLEALELIHEVKAAGIATFLFRG